jgi:hypothetical protein
MTNPYAAQLGDRDATEVLAATGSRLEALARKIGPERMGRPRAPGKWSPREILCHLADCELAHGFRLRQALGEDHHVVQPWDQELWAQTYAAYNAAAALGVFRAVRDWNLTLIRTVTPAALSKPVTHPERGEMTVRTLIETMAGHDLNHLDQLEAIVA